MDELIRALQAVVVRGMLDLSECDEAYRDEAGSGLQLPFRLNWTRGQKERQRALGEETLGAQCLFARAGDLAKGEDHEGWQKAMDEGNRLSVETQRHWMEWWGGILLMTAEECTALCDSLPDQHWMWVTAQVAARAREYEEEAVKKAGGPRSGTSGGRPRKRQRSGKKHS